MFSDINKIIAQTEQQIQIIENKALKPPFNPVIIW